MMEDGWTEVRRRKMGVASDGNTTEETTFFVTNIPNGATKAEFRKIFSQMGRLSDIYFGRNIGKNGKNYGFIRFIGVSDAKALELKLNGATCRNNKLEISVARHGRKTPPLPPGKINQNPRTVVPLGQNTSIHGGGFTDHRIYAQVTGHFNSRQPNKNIHQTTAPIRLHTDDGID
ncbi:unnamed protein product [Lactuca virosa]|uniref:RRM domain-containing protein n=1 Tax=Lactuca virosa TaxID=75947 RepID=A0AAU9LDI8_9ASTR|nr:unnamed protein product [Lactuca virosa]